MSEWCAGGGVLDVAGVGVGPFNLSLAALADGVRGLRTAFFEQRGEFRWHPGMLIERASLQVPFLADLVTLADPGSDWSFLRFLRERDRLFPFYFAERFHVERAEYDAYCRWVSGQLAGSGGSGGTRLFFGHRVEGLRWCAERGVFEVRVAVLGADGLPVSVECVPARNVVVGVGTEPWVPEVMRPLVEDASVPVVHSADYLAHRERLLAAGRVTVVGSGQSGAEVFLDLLRGRPRGREGLQWLSRSGAFAPMEYSKLGLEHFTPDYVRYFHGLAEPVRDALVPRQWQLHKAVDQETLAEVHEELYHRSLDGGWPDVVMTPGVAVRGAGRAAGGGVRLEVEHAERGERAEVPTDAVVLATGYRERSAEGLWAALDRYVCRDGSGRPCVDGQYRLVWDGPVAGSVFVQNAERHSHGVGAPDLGLAAFRSATILNAVAGEEVYRLPRRTAFTSFGLEGLVAAAGGPRVPGQAGARRG